MTTPTQVPPTEPGPPAPPQGPGVIVPFAAPPRDEDKTRTVVAIVIAVVIAVVLCGGGVVGVGAVVMSAGNAQVDLARDTASGFLDDIVATDYRAAYRSVCESGRHELSEEDFTDIWSGLGITSYRLGEVKAGDSGELRVDSTVNTADGRSDLTLDVVTEPGGTAMAVCGWLSECSRATGRSRLVFRP